MTVRTIGTFIPRRHGPCVYHDTSRKCARRRRDGTLRVERHDCWRAEYEVADMTGLRRVRKRFKTREGAYQWLGAFYAQYYKK